MAESKTHTFIYSHKDMYDKAAGFCFEDRRLELVYIETEEEE